MSAPQFGVSRFLQPLASERNPQRVGIYVETIYRKGKLNPGKKYRLTDGHGNFWEAESSGLKEVTP